MSQPKPFQIQQDGKFFTRLLSKESSMANPSARFLYYAVNRPSSVPFLWESKPGTRKPSTIFDHDDRDPHDRDDRGHHGDDRDDRGHHGDDRGHHGDDRGHHGDHFHVPPLTPPPSYYTKQKLGEKLDSDSNKDRFDFRHLHHHHRRRDDWHKRSRSSGLLSSILRRKFKIMASFGLKLRARRWTSSTSEGGGSVIDSATFRSCSTTTTSWFSSSALSFDSRENDEEEEEDEDNYGTIFDDDSSNSRICFKCCRR